MLIGGVKKYQTNTSGTQTLADCFCKLMINLTHTTATVPKNKCTNCHISVYNNG